MNIPIFRAKKKDSDEYVEGYYHSYRDNIVSDDIVFHRIVQKDKPLYRFYDIEPITLSIHFPDMFDSQGNKIFASLNEDGKGGDIMQDDEYIGITKYIDCQFVVEYENCIDNIDNGNFDVIGIQE